MYSFGLAPAQQLNVPTPLMPSQSINISLPVSTTGVVQRMDPLGNLQVNHTFAYLTVRNKELYENLFEHSCII
jgi:hypothetical protein